MGDTYFVRVDENDGKRLVLSVLTGTAGGLADFAYSRSFVLNALHDMVQRAVDVSLQSGSHRPGSSLTGDRVVPMLPRIKALEGKAALQKAIPELGHSEEWFRENVGTYVVSTKLLRRYNAHENKIRERVRAFETLKLGPFEWRDRMWLAGHSCTIEVELTDAKWGAHALKGWEIGTSAFDWWSGDPASTAPEGALEGTTSPPPPIPGGTSIDESAPTDAAGGVSSPTGTSWWKMGLGVVATGGALLVLGCAGALGLVVWDSHSSDEVASTVDVPQREASVADAAQPNSSTSPTEGSPAAATPAQDGSTDAVADTNADASGSGSHAGKSGRRVGR